MVGEIGVNGIDAVTVSIISKKKKKKSFLFSLQNELLWLLIPNSLCNCAKTCYMLEVNISMTPIDSNTPTTSANTMILKK